MISEAIQIAVKILFTGVLLLLISLCGIEIWRLWFDRTLVLVPFSYIRDGESVPEAGQYFTQLVSQDLNRLRDIYNVSSSGDVLIPRTDQSGDVLIASTDQIGRGEPFRLPVLRKSVLSGVEIQAYGINLSMLAKALTRWIERPNEIIGNVSECTKRVDVYAELTSPTPSATAKHPNCWYISQMADVNEASVALACRIFRMLTAIQYPLYAKVTDADFYVFTRALQNYHLYRTRLAEAAHKKEVNSALSEASQFVTELRNRDSRFPFVYKLAAYVYREEGRLSKAELAMNRYIALLKEYGQSDKKAEDLLALFQSKQPLAKVKVGTSSEVLKLRHRIRPIRPATSVGSIHATAGTICCIVQDDSGAQYLLSAEHPLLGEIGDFVLQPGLYDGGQLSDKVAELADKIPLQRDKANRVAGAIARIMQGVETDPEIPGVGKIIGIATAVRPGQTVQMVGRTSGLVEGKIVRSGVSAMIAAPFGIGSSFEKTLFEGLIETTPMSAGGDSGAPVLTKEGELIGMVYAGSSKTTLIMPIEPVLQALKVKLVQ